MYTTIEKNIVNQICNTNLPFHKLNKKKILISGCNGFIASSFINTLIRVMEIYGYKIKFYGIIRKGNFKIRDNLKELHKSKKLNIYKINLNEHIILNINPDICFHTASITAPKDYIIKPSETLLINSIGTINLLNFSIKKKIDKFILLSSGEIYGNFDRSLKKKLNENNYGYIDPTKVSSSYSISKKFSENALISWSAQFNLFTNSIRLFHTYGPNMKLGDGRIHSDLVNNVRLNKNLIIKGNPEVKRCFCYISDAISGILTVILKGKKNECYNLANTREMYKIKDIAKVILNNQTNRKLKIIFKKRKNVRNDFFYSTPSIFKLKKLGWEPKINASKGFSETINFYKKI
tara:strand:+ start:109 stop:1155 length:1047 start_codon:yes stop_codon:yes gene_type:complete